MCGRRSRRGNLAARGEVHGGNTLRRPGPLIGSAIDKNKDAQGPRGRGLDSSAPRADVDIDFRKDYWDAVLPALQSFPSMKVGKQRSRLPARSSPKSRWTMTYCSLPRAMTDSEGAFSWSVPRLSSGPNPNPSRPTRFPFVCLQIRGAAFFCAAKKYSTQNRVDADGGGDCGRTTPSAKSAEDGAGFLQGHR